jgi:cell division septation protein DedD
MAKQKQYAWEPSDSFNNEEHAESLMNKMRAAFFAEQGQRDFERTQEEGVAGVPGNYAAYGRQFAEGAGRPLELGLSYGAKALGLSSEASSLLGLQDPETITQMRQGYQGAAYQSYPEGATGTLLRGAMGTAQQIPSMMGMGAVGGLKGVVGMYAGQSYNDAYVEATNKGLTDEEAQKTALAAAAIEAGFTLGFSAIPGMGGAEEMVVNAGRRQLTSASMRQLIADKAKEISKDTGAELLEELSIEAANAYREAASGVDPNATDMDALFERAVDTAVQTIMMTGTLGAYNYASAKFGGRSSTDQQREEVDQLNEDTRQRREEILDAGDKRIEAGEDPQQVYMDVITELGDLADAGRQTYRDIYDLEPQVVPSGSSTPSQPQPTPTQPTPTQPTPTQPTPTQPTPTQPTPTQPTPTQPTPPHLAPSMAWLSSIDCLRDPERIV